VITTFDSEMHMDGLTKMVMVMVGERRGKQREVGFNAGILLLHKEWNRIQLSPIHEQLHYSTVS
jgi:hypothetical protein